jgi:hypothetical protein
MRAKQAPFGQMVKKLGTYHDMRSAMGDLHTFILSDALSVDYVYQ